MKKGKINKDNNEVRKPDLLERLPQSSIPWKRTKDEVWKDLENSIHTKPAARKISLSSYVLRLSAAAVLLILIGISSFMRFYTRTVSSKAEETVNLELPKGSAVTLNAETTIKYKPLWWTFKREIQMEGEAYFEVSRGNEFIVISDPGTTTVLGTTFNIYSRKGEYEVSCYSGKIKVESVDSGRQVILETNQKATLEEEGSLTVSEETTGPARQDWRSGYFRFTSMSVMRVFDEISRQYGVTIKGTENLDLIYTGNFSKDQSVKEVMQLVCKAFGIDFVIEDENTYRVIVDAD
ncbi:MAG: FecR family protein [Bacteroidota bacterium]|nr:FecR family protein [Bacteroidota bacterium]